MVIEGSISGRRTINTTQSGNYHRKRALSQPMKIDLPNLAENQPALTIRNQIFIYNK